MTPRPMSPLVVTWLVLLGTLGVLHLAGISIADTWLPAFGSPGVMLRLMPIVGVVMTAAVLFSFVLDRNAWKVRWQRTVILTLIGLGWLALIVTYLVGYLRSVVDFG